MKFTNLKMAFAVCSVCAVFAGNAAAQGIVRTASAELNDSAAYYISADDEAQPSPSDVPVPGEETAADMAKAAGKDGKDGCKSSKDCCCDDLVPYELFPRTCNGIKVGGWVQIGYHTEGTNGDGTGLFNNYPHVVQLQQAYAYAEKETDTGGCGWDWGFRIDYVYGTDGPNTQAFGNQPGRWDEGWDNGAHYGHAIPQAYATLAYNNLTVKGGHFYTIQGYEVVPATGNFFYSHAFTMNNNKPFTHTGVLAEYAYGDRLTLYGGWVQGWDTGFNDNGGDAFLGGFTYQLRDDLSFTYTVTAGDFGFDTGNGSDDDAYMQSIVVDWQVTDRLEYVFLSDYNDNDLFRDGVVGGASKAWSIANYLFYDINDCWRAGVRYEYYDDQNLMNTGNDSQVNAVTAGLNWMPHTNLRIRPEVRFEDYGAGSGRRDQTLFGIDAIMTF